MAKQNATNKETGKKQTRYDMRMERRRKLEAKKERSRKITIGVIAAIVICIVLAIGAKVYSKYQDVNGTYISIGDHEITKGEFDYYYNNCYYSYVNNYGQYISYFGLDTSKPLDQQSYSDTMTWKDYFEQQAVNQMKMVYALKDAGEAEGFVYDTAEEVENNMQTISDAADNAEMKVAEYLTSQFGEYAKTDKIRKYMADSSYAAAYYNEIDGAIEVSDDEINAYYEENKDDFDSVDYLMCTIKADIPEDEATEADGGEAETEELSEEEKTAKEAAEAAVRDAAMAEAQKQAESMLAEVTDKESFLAVYDKYATDTETEAEHIGSAKSSVVSTGAADWLFDSARKAGDITVIENSGSDSWCVVLFEDRYLKHEKTFDMRHILVQFEQEETDSETGETEVTEEAKAAAKAEAEKIYQEWKDGAATEDSFAELANTYSDDTGSNTNGGLYEAVYDGRMVSSVNDWLFDESRKTGDTGLVETEYGWHVMYFVGENAERWHVNIENTLHSNKAEEQVTALTDALEVKDSKGVLNYLKAQEAETETGAETEGETGSETASETEAKK